MTKCSESWVGFWNNKKDISGIAGEIWIKSGV